MPVNSTHVDYDDWLSRAAPIRTILKGERAVKNAGAQFLPELAGLGFTENKNYRERANWYAATARTKSAWAGALFQKPVTITLPDTLEYLLKDATFDGVGLDMVIQHVADEVLSVGRAGILVDMNTDTQFCYMAPYVGESIINWRTQNVNGKNVLTLVVLKETYEFVNPSDPFKVEHRDRYRVLQLENVESGNPVYSQVMYSSDSKFDIANVPDEGSYVVPTVKNKTLDFIPFYFFNSTHTLPVPTDSPLMDIMNVNISHYRNSADLEHALHFSALPTPYMTGAEMLTKEQLETPIRIGSSQLLTMPTGCTLGMLEFTGSGVGAIKQNMDDKEHRMAALGARMLIADKTGTETAYAERVRNTAENNSLSTLAHVLEDGFDQALMDIATWMNIATSPKDTHVRINKDFTAQPITPQELTTLFQLFLQDGIDEHTLIYKMMSGSITPPDWTPENMETLLQNAKAEHQKTKEAELKAKTAPKPNV